MTKTPLPIAPNRFNHWEKRKAPMTIAIGILCHAPLRVILAADTKWSDSLGRESYASKIAVIRFGTSDVIVARAGCPTVSQRIIDIVRGDSRSKEISCAEVVTETFEEALRKFRARLDAHQMESLKDSPAMLMYAFMDNMEPKLYILDVSGPGISQAPNPGEHFASIGIGNDVADYLLAELSHPQQAEEMAITVAITAIQKVKKHQPNTCGGETNVILVGPSGAYLNGISVGKSLPMMQEAINRTENENKTHLFKAQLEMMDKCKEDLKRIAAETWGEYIAKIKAEEPQKNLNLPVDNPNITG